MNVEAVDAVHALELLEAVEWHLARTRDELEKLGKLLLVKRPDRTPEPLDLLARGRVVVVLGVALPVVDVDVRQTRDEKF